MIKKQQHISCVVTIIFFSYIPVGSKLFKGDGAVNLGGGREMWSGYNLTVRPTGRWKLMLNIDTSATGFYRHITVLEFLQEVVRCDTRKELSDRDRKTFEREIKGNYGPNNF